MQQTTTTPLEPFYWFQERMLTRPVEKRLPRNVANLIGHHLKIQLLTYSWLFSSIFYNHLDFEKTFTAYTCVLVNTISHGITLSEDMQSIHNLFCKDKDAPKYIIDSLEMEELQISVMHHERGVGMTWKHVFRLDPHSIMGFPIYGDPIYGEEMFEDIYIQEDHVKLNIAIEKMATSIIWSLCEHLINVLRLNRN
jgi:hypothetical protein